MKTWTALLIGDVRVRVQRCWRISTNSYCLVWPLRGIFWRQSSYPFLEYKTFSKNVYFTEHRMFTLLNIKYPKSRMCCQKTACGQYFSFWYSTVNVSKISSLGWLVGLWDVTHCWFFRFFSEIPLFHVWYIRNSFLIFQNKISGIL